MVNESNFENDRTRKCCKITLKEINYQIRDREIFLKQTLHNIKPCLENLAKSKTEFSDGIFSNLFPSFVNFALQLCGSSFTPKPVLPHFSHCCRWCWQCHMTRPSPDTWTTLWTPWGCGRPARPMTSTWETVSNGHTSLSTQNTFAGQPWLFLFSLQHQDSVEERMRKKRRGEKNRQEGNCCNLAPCCKTSVSKSLDCSSFFSCQNRSCSCSNSMLKNHCF